MGNYCRREVASRAEAWIETRTVREGVQSADSRLPCGGVD